MAFLPVARSRLRRLPRPQPAGPQARFEAADRQAAVAGFLADPAARDAGSADPVRFWAEALSGYGALVPEAPPTQVGPIRLAHVLLGYIPTMFELTEQQRAGMSAGVTAWVRWAAVQNHLDEVARDRIEATLPKVLATFQD